MPLEHELGGTGVRSAWWAEQASAVARMKAAVLTDRRKHSDSAKEWLRRAHAARQWEPGSGPVAVGVPAVETEPEPEPEPELEQESNPESGLALQPVVWGTRAGSEWTLTQRGLEEEAERNEVNIQWRGTGPLGVVWRGLRCGGSEDDDFGDSEQDMYACVHRTYPPSGRDPCAPYEATSAWLRMVGKQAKDDEQYQQQDTAPSALKAVAAQQFCSSFEMSQSMQGISQGENRGTHSSLGADNDPEKNARERVMTGMLLHRIQGKLLDPSKTFTLKDALKPLQRLRSGVAPSVVHTTFLHDHGRYYEACFYERTLPQLHIVQPIHTDPYGASSASFGVRLAQASGQSTPDAFGWRQYCSKDSDGRFGWSSEMRPRLVEAAVRGMMIAAIQDAATEEWTRADVITRLRELCASPARPVRITLVARRASAAWGGLHDRARGASPVQPLPVASRYGWEALLAAGRRESAATRQAVAQLVKAEGRGRAVFMENVGMNSEDPKSKLSLADCYKAKYGELRPAVDKDWDRY